MGRIQSLARFRIHPGKTEEFKRLSANCMALAREKDVGTIRYDVSISPDGTEALVYEEYASSEACIQHFNNMGDNAAAIFEIVETDGVMWGEPSEELRKNLQPYGVVIYPPFQRLEG